MLACSFWRATIDSSRGETFSMRARSKIASWRAWGLLELTAMVASDLHEFCMTSSNTDVAFDNEPLSAWTTAASEAVSLTGVAS